jgi:hypothetical protein
MHQLIGLIGLLFAAAAPAGTPQGLEWTPADTAAVGATCGDMPMAQLAALPVAQRTARLACYTRESARRLSTRLPHQVDDVTVLERISVDGTELTYHNKVSVLRADVPAAAIQTFTTNVRTTVCNSEGMRNTIQVGGSYRYIWVDRNGEPLAQLLVTSC